ncbi:carboxypeptidase-like regulatory domain-containing protein [Flavobacterium microcysteis]|uniref:Carboxypeptidase-like regulatory domain-containing protein n=1 Tax=Flavobacterium microcysteis TaxID=2596891 RepID=A0A501PZX3_9FLAO|nr:carboxypeptidase-like regulatory domain-containing protein [Flavobacterium microcysteis]TPD65612.1 carboxypeptidase-like regulatory domain-containing protein [Flavobacterium microcysteis]
MKTNFLIACFFIVQLVFSQEKIIHGKVTGNGNNVEGINVVNLVNEKSAVTNANGEFQILAKEEDLLVLSALNFEYKRKIIDAGDLKSEVVIIEMIPKANQLDEVEITKYNNINAVDLGILSKPAKVYTPAERKVRTATTGLLDPLINLMSGRTKRLKQNISVEKKEMLLEKVNDLFEDDFYTQTLKINPDLIMAFKYFCIEDFKFASAVRAKNKTLATFWINELAVEYNKLQSNEKQ